jgi:hypothetical protein
MKVNREKEGKRRGEKRRERGNHYDNTKPDQGGYSPRSS